MDNNQISRNWFVIIRPHLTKVSTQIIQFIIFERNELSITLSTLWFRLLLTTCNITIYFYDGLLNNI